MVKKLNFLKGIILLISFYAGGNMRAATYYVSNTGSDAANGTSQSTAWATIAKVNSAAILPGDAVLFQAGGVWREELSLKQGSSGAGKRVYYGRYGTGANPKILGSVKAITWTATAYANIWQSATSVANPRSGGWGYPGEVFFVTDDSTSWGSVQTYTSNFSNLNAEFEWAWSGNRIYVYSTTDPDTRYDAVEVVQRDLCAGFTNSASSYIEFNGIDLHYAKRAGFGNQNYPQADNQTDVTIRNCNIGYIGEKGGAYAYGIEGFHSNFLVEKCTITDCGRRGISFNLYEATVNPALNLTNIIIRYNVFKRGYHTTSLDIATDAQEPGHSMENIYFYGNLVDDHEIKMTGDDAGSNQVYFQPYDSYFNNIYVFNNVFISATMRNILVTGGDNVYIHNNTIYTHNPNIKSSPWGNISIVRDAKARVSNNIIYDDLPANTAIDNWCIMSDTPDGNPVTFVSLDYNLYYHMVQNDGDRGFFGGRDWGYNRMSGWSAFRTQYPAFEAHSPVPAEPQFKNKAIFDLTLTSTSPATNKGVVLPYFIVTDGHGKTDTINKYDFAGNLRSRTTPSIGAYEYVTQSSSTANITSFSLAQQAGAATINTTSRTVNIQVVNGTSLTSLVPTIAVSPGATISPATGVAQNFTNPVTYTVTAQNGTTQTWTVTVTVQLSSASNITSFSLAAQTGAATINSTNRTVSIQVANGTSLTSLVPTIAVSPGATINPASGVAQNFTNPVTYTVTAQNGTTQAWTVTVSVAPSAAANITSFSLAAQTGAATINSTNRTVSIQVANGTSVTSLVPTIGVSAGATISPASGVAQNFTNPVTYTVTAQNGTTQAWTVTVSVAPSAASNITSFSLAAQTGAATINSTNRTVSIQVANGTSVTSLVPTIGVSAGATISPASGVAQNFTTPVIYTVTAQNGTTQTWTVTVTVKASSEATITSCSIPQQTDPATINTTNRTVAVQVANGTNLTSLTPTITVCSGASINPASGVAQNFSNPVVYAVTAEDGTTQSWTVAVTPKASTEAQITSFSLSAQTGTATINSTTGTVNIQVAFGTVLTNLIPTIAVSPGATINPASGAARDFTVPVTYTVTAQDGVTQKLWTVTVTVAPQPVNSAPVIKVAFKAKEVKGKVYLLDASGSYDVDNQALTYTWVVPAEFSASALTGSSISVMPTENALVKTYRIKLTVSDGIVSVVKNLNISVVEYNTTVQSLSVNSIVASDYETGNEPEDIVDNNLLTRWSADGDNEWLVFELANESTLSHFLVSFHNGKTRTSAFDVYASSDNQNWDLLVNRKSSCGFSNNLQLFEVPQTFITKSYKYVKLVGHMNSVNSWNSYTEFKTFGLPVTNQKNTLSALGDGINMDEIVEVYPNPAVDYVTVKVVEESTIRVINLSGDIVHVQKAYDENTRLDYLFKPGVYFIQVINNNNETCTKKLVVK